jgi:hypothetical protein
MWTVEGVCRGFVRGGLLCDAEQKETKTICSHVTSPLKGSLIQPTRFHGRIQRRHLLPFFSSLFPGTADSSRYALIPIPHSLPLLPPPPSLTHSLPSDQPSMETLAPHLTAHLPIGSSPVTLAKPGVNPAEFDGFMQELSEAMVRYFVYG